MREEKIASLEMKIEEFANHQMTLYTDFDQHAQWQFINEQRKNIITVSSLCFMFFDYYTH